MRNPVTEHYERLRVVDELKQVGLHRLAHLTELCILRSPLTKKPNHGLSRLHTLPDYVADFASIEEDHFRSPHCGLERHKDFELKYLSMEQALAIANNDEAEGNLRRRAALRVAEHGQIEPAVSVLEAIIRRRSSGLFVRLRAAENLADDLGCRERATAALDAALDVSMRPAHRNELETLRAKLLDKTMSVETRCFGEEFVQQGSGEQKRLREKAVETSDALGVRNLVMDADTVVEARGLVTRLPADAPETILRALADFASLSA